MFIALEGVDGAGKTTQAQLLTRYLEGKGISVVRVRTPGGCPTAEKLRAVFDEQMRPETQYLVVLAAINDTYHNVIAPALDEGKWVIADRWIDSSAVYQDISTELLNWCCTLGIQVVPDHTFILNADPMTAEKRSATPTTRTAWKAERYTHRPGHHLNANESIEEVQNEIRTILGI
jgi:dTMP kinase